MIYPKVLIIGETFRRNGGGGITLLNLFRDWPVDRIAVITDNIAETEPTTQYQYYQLGSLEVKFPLPFNKLQAKVASGPYHFLPGNIATLKTLNKKGIFNHLKKIIRPGFDHFLSLCGLSSRFYSIGLSKLLIDWILDFDPDIIYIQPFLHKTMRFGNLLYGKLHIPYVVHIMDDSVKYVNKSLLFWRLNQRQIEKDFNQLILNAKLHLCISEAMAEEYYNRYGKIFLPFRNPIDINLWLPYQKQISHVRTECLKIIYTGRLNSPTMHSLIEMCQVVDGLNRNDKKAEIHIYTHDRNEKFNNIIRKLDGVKLFEPVGINEMPPLIQKYNIFFLCLDFDKRAQKYSQFSISTRTSEGMISGVPILIYAPKGSALSKYFDENKAGLIVVDKSKLKLEEALLTLWNDHTIRQKLSSNAIRKSLSDSNSVIVRENFRKAISDYNNE